MQPSKKNARTRTDVNVNINGHRDTEEWVAVRFAPRGLKRSYLPLHARTTRSARRITSTLVPYRHGRLAHGAY